MIIDTYDYRMNLIFLIPEVVWPGLQSKRDIPERVERRSVFLGAFGREWIRKNDYSFAVFLGTSWPDEQSFKDEEITTHTYTHKMRSY